MLVAADLDNAVHEFYTHYKPLIEKGVEQYLKEVRESNAERKGADYEEPDRVRMQECWDEGYRYWIGGEVVRYYAGAGATATGQLTARGRYALAKRAAYDITDKSNRGAQYYQAPDVEEPPI